MVNNSSNSRNQWQRMIMTRTHWPGPYASFLHWGQCTGEGGDLTIGGSLTRWLTPATVIWVEHHLLIDIIYIILVIIYHWHLPKVTKCIPDWDNERGPQATVLTQRPPKSERPRHQVWDERHFMMWNQAIFASDGDTKGWFWWLMRLCWWLKMVS